MSDIGQQRLIHELPRKFDISDQHLDHLTQQMSPEDQAAMARFSGGFEAEDWYRSLFSVLPWTILIHGLDQHQFPQGSKQSYQVPDFLTLVEATSMDHVPLLIEVKRVATEKESLKIPTRQASLTREYARRLHVMLLYAIYWDRFGFWTLNTFDSFEDRSSRRTLSLLRALELDCSGVFGDVSFLVFPPMSRKTVFSTEAENHAGIKHEKYGGLVSDSVTCSSGSIELSTLESAVFDAIFEMKTTEVLSDNDTTIVSGSLENTCSLKLSWWISRHIALYGPLQQEDYVNVSAHVITELTERLGIQYFHMYPQGATEDITTLQKVCMTACKSES